jgi:hypothetical protein
MVTGLALASFTGMAILLTALLTIGLIVTLPSSSSAQATERHSGTVIAVDVATRTLVLRELVEDGRPRRLQVRVPEGAAVVYSERVPDEQVTRLDAAFNERALEIGDVRPGDFVVVEGAARGNEVTASTVVVTLREHDAQGAPAASPGPRPRP